MTKTLALPARQVTALCKGAAKAGFIPEVKIGDVVVRLIPADSARPEQPIDDADNPESFETWDQYQTWRDRRNARAD